MTSLKLRESYTASDGSYWGGYWSRGRTGNASHIPMDLIYDIASFNNLQIDYNQKLLKRAKNPNYGPRILTIARYNKETYSKAFRRTVEEFIRGER